MKDEDLSRRDFGRLIIGEKGARGCGVGNC
jgi:hypothetical protein